MLSLLVVWGGDCGLVCFGLRGGGLGVSLVRCCAVDCLGLLCEWLLCFGLV